MTNTYELALIFHTDLDGQGRDKMLELVEKMVKNFGGEVTKRDEAGKKPLAYEIKKQFEGWFYFLNLQLPAESVSKLDTKLRVEDKILRYLLIKRVEKKS